MSVRVLSAADVERLLPMAECIDVMAAALTDLAGGRIHQPPRTVIVPPDAAGLMGLMPVYRGGGRPLYALKSICVFPGNPARGKDAHQGVVVLYSAETGEPIAFVNASALTAIRTAAVSGLATRLLSRADAGDLAIIGSGVQARWHLDALACVRSLRRVRVASRSEANARRFAGAASARHGIAVEASASVEAAVRGADLIVTATTAAEPVLRRAWVADGAHINAVGAVPPTAREIDSATVAAARLYVDDREAAQSGAGDYLFPLREGVIGADHIVGSLGDVLTESRAGRIDGKQITLFKSLGLAVEDLAAAEHAYRAALAEDAGVRLEF